MPRKIEISYRTIIFMAVLGVFIWFLVQIKAVILTLFIALILMSVLNSLVRKLESIKFPRWLAILAIYLLVLALMVFAIWGVIPPLIEQTSNLVKQIPALFKQFKILGIDEKVLANQLDQFSAVPADVIKIILGVFSNIVSVLALAAITFYLLLERANLDRYLTLLFGEGKEKEIKAVIDRIEIKLGGWIRGQAFLMLFVGILYYIGYRVIGLNFALPLAILAFLLDIIPGFGATMAAIPAVLLGLALSPIHAIAVVGWVFLIQQLENTILVPRIMKKTAEVNPLVSILSLAIGFEIAGVGGALLAIPSYIVLEVIISTIFSSQKFKET